MYSLILNNCVPYSQYVGSFGPYEAGGLGTRLDLDYMALLL